MLGIFLNEIRSFPNWSANASLHIFGRSDHALIINCTAVDRIGDPTPLLWSRFLLWWDRARAYVYTTASTLIPSLSMQQRLNAMIWILVLRLLPKTLRQGKRAVRYQSMCIVQAFRSPSSELKRQTCCCFYCGMFWWQGKTEATEEKKWVAPAEVWWNVGRQLVSIVMKCLSISFFHAGEHYSVPFECLKL